MTKSDTAPPAPLASTIRPSGAEGTAASLRGAPSGAGDDVEPRRINGTFPRSHLFRFLCDHPIAIAAVVVTTGAVGPSRLARWSSGGAKVFQRHAPAMAPLMLQLARARRVRPPPPAG
jgi:hypothetical protein